MRTPLDITSREYKMRRRRKTLRCALCPPHGGENQTRYVKHGVKKPRKTWR